MCSTCAKEGGEKKVSTSSEKLEVLLRPKMTLHDICILLEVGHAKARQYADEFRKWYEEEYPDSPWFGIPTDLFTKLFNIDESRIIRNAEIEKKMRK